MTEKEHVLKIIENNGLCFQIYCSYCPIYDGDCEISQKYKRAVEWLITNGYKEDLLELLI